MGTKTFIPAYREQIHGWNICGKGFRNTAPESVQEMARRLAPLYAKRVLVVPKLGGTTSYFIAVLIFLSRSFRAVYFFTERMFSMINVELKGGVVKEYEMNTKLLSKEVIRGLLKHEFGNDPRITDKVLFDGAFLFCYLILFFLSVILQNIRK